MLYLYDGMLLGNERNSRIRVTTQIQLKHVKWEEETKKQSLL